MNDTMKKLIQAMQQDPSRFEDYTWRDLIARTVELSQHKDAVEFERVMKQIELEYIDTKVSSMMLLGKDSGVDPNIMTRGLTNAAITSSSKINFYGADRASPPEHLELDL